MAEPLDTPMKTLTYAIPDNTAARRRTYQEDYVLRRARQFRDFIALVPVELQAEAVALVIQIEQDRAREDDTISDSWRQDVQLAYSTGRLEVLNDQVRDMTGEGDPPEVLPLRLH